MAIRPTLTATPASLSGRRRGACGGSQHIINTAGCSSQEGTGQGEGTKEWKLGRKKLIRILKALIDHTINLCTIALSVMGSGELARPHTGTKTSQIRS